MKKLPEDVLPAAFILLTDTIRQEAQAALNYFAEKWRGNKGHIRR